MRRKLKPRRTAFGTARSLIVKRNRTSQIQVLSCRKPAAGRGFLRSDLAPRSADWHILPGQARLHAGELRLAEGKLFMLLAICDAWNKDPSNVKINPHAFIPGPKR